MKIAVTGKGGVGKTTFAATLARLYAAEGRPVLAADVDRDLPSGSMKTHWILSFPFPKCANWWKSGPGRRQGISSII